MIELALPVPQTPGEWLALSAALATILLGLVHLLLPRGALGLRHADPEFIGTPASGIARARAGGFHVGLGVAAILLGQPLVFLALGLAWAGSALGRLLSLLLDPAGRGRAAALLLVEMLLAAGSVAGPLGWIG